MDQATGTILDAILFFDPGAKWSIVAINAILSVHLLTALPIISTPICLVMQRQLIKNKGLIVASAPFPILINNIFQPIAFAVRSP